MASFRGWSERLRGIEVGVVQLPGRDSRLREPLIASVAAAADGVVEAMASQAPYPTVLFGHGLGAIVAFEIARRLRALGWPLLTLFVSGRRAPGIPDALASLSTLPADELIGEVSRRYDIVSPSMLADPDLIRLVIPGLRADFVMADTYQYEGGAPLDCPIVACGSLADPFTSRADLEAWKVETRSRFSTQMFAGGYSYVQREQEALTAVISNQVSVMVGAMARWMGVR